MLETLVAYYSQNYASTFGSGLLRALNFTTAHKLALCSITFDGA